MEQDEEKLDEVSILMELDRQFREIGAGLSVIQYFLKDIKHTKLVLKKRHDYLKTYTSDINSVIRDAKKIKKEIDELKRNDSY